MIRVTMATALRVRNLRACRIANHNGITTRASFTLVSVSRGILARLLDNVARPRVQPSRNRIEVRTLLTGNFRRHTVLTVNPRRRISSHLIHTTNPLQLTRVHQRLPLRRPNAIFGRSQRHHKVHLSVTPQLRNVRPNTIRGRPIRLRYRRNITIMPRIRHVALQDRRFPPSVRVIALSITGLATTSPSRIRSF